MNSQTSKHAHPECAFDDKPWYGIDVRRSACTTHHPEDMRRRDTLCALPAVIPLVDPYNFVLLVFVSTEGSRTKT
eukprot:7453182-Pyramimonas_sp.AAC.1